MGNLVATFSNPQQNYQGTGASEAVALDGSTGATFVHDLTAVSTANFFISHSISAKYELETTATNPIQKNSTVSCVRDGATWFSGFVNRKINSVVAPNGQKFMQVEAYGKDGVLLKTFCKKDGRDIWSMRTTAFSFTDVVLKASTSYGSFEGATLWPDPADSDGIRCYLHDSVCNNDTLAFNIGIGTYAITAINQVAKTFTVADHIDYELLAGMIITIDGSTGNDGDYTVVSATWDTNHTDIVVSQAILDATADGNLLNESIALSTSNKGIKVRGWVKIGTEWIYHDGYDDAESDGIWRLRGCKRGELGTAAAAHLATVVCYEKLTKMMAPDIIRLDNKLTVSAEWIELKFEEGYKINYDLCCFILPGAVASIYYQADFAVYDEDRAIGTHAISGVTLDHTFTTADDLTTELYPGDTLVILGSTANDGDYTVSTVTWHGGNHTDVVVIEDIPDATVDGSMISTVIVTLNDVVRTLCKISCANQGPGFTDAMLDLQCSSVMINRYDYDPINRPKYTWDAIQEVIAQLGIDEEVAFFYSHPDDKFKLIFMANAALNFTAPWSTRIDKSDSLDEVFSAVRVEYDYDQDFNRISPDFSWHQAATGTPASPTHWQTTEDDKPKIVTAQSDAAGNFGIDHISDGKQETALRGTFKYNPAVPIEFGHFWFGTPVANVPPVTNLNKVTLRIGAYCLNNLQLANIGDGGYEVLLYGCDDYNSLTHAPATQWHPLGVSMKAASSNNYTVNEHVAESFAISQINCLRIVFNFLTHGFDALGDVRMMVIHDLIVECSVSIEGGSKGLVTVELTDNPLLKNDPTKIYAPDTFRKLRGGVGASVGVAGTPSCEHYPIDVASDQAAISLARYRLLVKLRKYQEREYEYRGFLPAVPRLGITVGVDETGDGVADYTGVMRSCQTTVGSDGILIKYSILNYDAAVIT